MTSVNFLEDLKSAIAEELTKQGYPPHSSDCLQAVLIRYFNLINRIPPTRKWLIHQSCELKNKIPHLAQDLQQGLSLFISKAESGENLEAHLSRKFVNNPDAIDLMNCDWRISHFHLGLRPSLRNPDLIESTTQLLFATFDPTSENMYLLDIQPHGNFSNQIFLKILEDNWPDILDQSSIAGRDFLDLPIHLSDSEIKDLREQGINPVVVTPQGRVLAQMGGGLSKSSIGLTVSLACSRQATSLQRNVRDLQKGFEEDRAEIEDRIRENLGLRRNQSLQFKVIHFNLYLNISGLGRAIESLEIKEITSDQKLHYCFNNQWDLIKD